jgi:hypothetical protein
MMIRSTLVWTFTLNSWLTGPFLRSPPFDQDKLPVREPKLPCKRGRVAGYSVIWHDVMQSRRVLGRKQKLESVLELLVHNVDNVVPLRPVDIGFRQAQTDFRQ